MNLKTLFMATALILSFHSHAGTTWNKLITPALYPIAPNVFTCSLTNVTTTNLKARIRIFDGHGVEVKDSHVISIPARNTKFLEKVGRKEGGYMYCEFTVEGKKSWYRGVAKMYHPQGNDFIAVAAE